MKSWNINIASKRKQREMMKRDLQDMKIRAEAIPFSFNMKGGQEMTCSNGMCYAWLFMVMYGFVRLWMVTYGYEWLCMVTYGYVWLLTVMYGYQWLCMVIYGCVCLCMVMYGYGCTLLFFTF